MVQIHIPGDATARLLFFVGVRDGLKRFLQGFDFRALVKAIHLAALRTNELSFSLVPVISFVTSGRPSAPVCLDVFEIGDREIGFAAIAPTSRRPPNSHT